MKIFAVVVATFNLAFLSGSAGAGLFDNLMDAADGAMATYGRDLDQHDRHDLSRVEIEVALREALALGALATGDYLLEQDGYYQDPTLRIPLPRAWSKAREAASRVGYTREFNRLQRQLNRAADEAIPEIVAGLQKELRSLQFEQPRALLHSVHSDAATRYLRAAVNEQLALEIRQVVASALIDNGAQSASQKLAAKVSSLPMVGSLETDLTDHVVGVSLDGFFRRIGREEGLIRANPQRSGSALLRRVFG